MAALRAQPTVSGGIAPGAVSADSLAQDVTLVTNTIKSSDYVPGVQGWNISGTGVAEFSNIYVRGDINAETGTIGYWNISSPGVERTIGARKLFGTFLESSDFGANDDTVDSGVYVGLFKSYYEDAIPVTGASRTNNIVTITSPNHGYLNGDYVIVQIDDDNTTQYGTGSVPTIIIEVTKDTFKYQNVGTDTVFIDELGVPTSQYVTGTATLYNKDVAGIYLQDYGKKVFDYGYFSNEGVSYVSAETFNLVHNPSFELVVDGIPTSNVAGWSVANTSAVTVNALAFSSETSAIDGMYRAISDYGLNVDWSSAPSDGTISATTNYALVDDLVSDDPTLYLHLNVFATPYHEATSVHVSGYVSNTSTVVITTDTAHGLSVGDYVYQSMLSPAASDDIVTVPGGDSYVLQVANVASNTVFWVTNVFADSGTTVTASTPSAVVAKIDVPEFRITEMYLDFGNSSTLVPLTDVMTDGWLARHTANPYNGKLSLTESEINASIYNDYENNQILVKNAPPLGIIHRPTSGAHRVDLELEISLAKLYKSYRLKNPVGLANKDNFKIVFPAKIHVLPSGDTYTAGSYVLDSVALSTEKRFFYAESAPISYTWYSEADKPNTPSVQDTKQWLDINLTNQTASYKYTDSLEFKSPSFSNDLTINSGVYTVNTLENEEILWQGLHSDTTSSSLFISSGAYTKTSEITANAEVTMQSYALSIVGPTHTSYQISSDLSYANVETGDYIRTHAASIALDSYEDVLPSGTIRDRGSQIWASADNIIFSNRNAVVGDSKNLKVSIYGATEMSGSLTVLSTSENPATVTIPSVNDTTSLDNHAATVKLVKDSKQVYYLPTGNVASEVVYTNTRKIYVSPSQPGSGADGDIWIRI